MLHDTGGGLSIGKAVIYDIPHLIQRVLRNGLDQADVFINPLRKLLFKKAPKVIVLPDVDTKGSLDRPFPFLHCQLTVKMCQIFQLTPQAKPYCSGNDIILDRVEYAGNRQLQIGGRIISLVLHICVPFLLVGFLQLWELFFQLAFKDRHIGIGGSDILPFSR